ncbi:MAG TPA: diaminopimelate epimerase [Paludibacteraceae bacterium]|jgi:diaminopimelate epimerase|nr:MAG: Diaminopimelate epimerase [Bacteroidetes bacterium ADurb.BinA395]HOF98948.1 diaminopimelate epimerase [Paludibacteraceae bacterium]HOJ66692.1 diaminopimelate epimerase [Paludibacteraceae bacterium]HOL29139.1 diaminopimelate epimerase [Paludibacteraceae bacterium]HON01892.1 diaminopimelate epimerase [Paludibacteraceae bacterium]
MKFTKMHGIGNDYIYINGFEEQLENPGELSIRLSDRHKGVGSDGLVIILPSSKADFRMQMFNADGSEAEMCGNAARCIGKYVYEKGMTDKTELTLETLAGIKTLQLFLDERNNVVSVTVDMGKPVLEAEKIPTTLPGKQIVNFPVSFDGINYAITCVSMGNPHTVIFTENIANMDIEKMGKKIENAPIFPRRTNVEFIEVIDKSRIEMRVWERGSGETMACGTGACASVVAGVLNGLVSRKATVELLGGNLEIEWNENDEHVYLTGPAETVFEGEIS